MHSQFYFGIVRMVLNAAKMPKNQSTTKHALPLNLFTKSTPNWSESVSNKEKKDTIHLCTNVSFHVVYKMHNCKSITAYWFVLI